MFHLLWYDKENKSQWRCENTNNDNWNEARVALHNPNGFIEQVLEWFSQISRAEWQPDPSLSRWSAWSCGSCYVQRCSATLGCTSCQTPSGCRQRRPFQCFTSPEPLGGTVHCIILHVLGHVCVLDHVLAVSQEDFFSCLVQQRRMDKLNAVLVGEFHTSYILLPVNRCKINIRQGRKCFSNLPLSSLCIHFFAHTKYLSCKVVCTYFLCAYVSRPYVFQMMIALDNILQYLSLMSSKHAICSYFRK